MHIKTTQVVNSLNSAGATTATMDLKTVVASFNNDGKINMKVVSMDDKNLWDVGENSNNTFSGTITEHGLKTTDNDKVFGGGLAGFTTLRKLNRPPKQFRDFNVDTEYAKQYNKVYPPSS